MTACTSCGTGNKPGRRFCVECGSPLSAACPACGSAVEAGEKFCGSCGAALSAGVLPRPASITARPGPAPGGVPRIADVATGAAWSRPRAGHDAPLAERRLVSVLFADLVGFTPFAEGRDPEAVREVLSRYFELASEVIRRYGGSVEKFIGDAVMAVWGAPVAHEDDAERAVRAGLELLDAIRSLGEGISGRAGVLTGEAAVTLGATNEGMVAGDLVNTASRLQSVAPSGAVLVGESTMRAASGAIAFEPAGDQTLKGKVVPVPAWRALRVVAEVGGRNRSDGLEAPFVGRDDEMRQLKDLFHGSGRDRRVRLVSVVGPAGIGKSRLAWEFLKYVDGLVETVWWHQGRCPAYGEGITFWALGEMVRGRCGLLESEDEATTRRQVAATLAEHVPDEAERRWIEPALLALLGAGGPAIGSEQLFAAWRTFFERLAASAPLVMVFEDLHWADAGTLDFIDHVLEWSRGLPITVLTLARPELLERRPDWGAGKRHFTSIFLEPLSEPAMRELLAGLVPGLPERAARAIVSRADGIPLYAVETVRSLLAEGRLREEGGAYAPVGDLSDLSVPESLTALIASRLDALEPADRALLQDAAVLGQTFTPAALAALSGSQAADLEPRLRALVRRELLALEADPRSPERGQYSFVQALIREVAYNTLARRDRRARHLAAARWFEGLDSGELAGALARHYLAAWESSPEGDEAQATAIQARLALGAAAERATALGSHEQALTFLGQAVSVTADPAEQATLLERAAEAAGNAGRYVDQEALARRALAIHAAAGDRLGRARATRSLGVALGNQRKVREHMALIEPAVAEFADLRPHPDVLALERTLAGGLSEVGEKRRALEIIERVLEDAEHTEQSETLVRSLDIKGSILCDLGRTTEGLALLETAAREAAAMGREDLALNSQGNFGVYLLALDPRRALEATRSLIDLALRLGRRGQVVINTLNAAEEAIRTGEWAWADARLAAALEEDLEPADRLLALENVTILAAYRGGDGAAMLAEQERLAAGSADLDDLLNERRAAIAFAAGRLAEARERWRRVASWSALNAPVALPKAARAALWARDADAARTDLADLDATGVHGPAIKASRATMLAGLATLAGETGEARAHYRDAGRAWRDLGLPWDEALLGIDMALLLGPGVPDVSEAAGRARAILEDLGARPFLAVLDGSRAVATVGDAAMRPESTPAEVR